MDNGSAGRGWPANRLLWERPTERARTFLLAMTVRAGGAVRAHFHHQDRRRYRPIA